MPAPRPRRARGADAYGDADAMLAAESPDLVDIATPPQSHLGLAEITARRGVHAVCQKPLAPTQAEAVRLVTTAEDEGVTLFVHESFRWTPWHREIAVHWIDTFRYVVGEMTGVFARLRRLNPAIDGEDAGLVTFAFEIGAAGLWWKPHGEPVRCAGSRRYGIRAVAWARVACRGRWRRVKLGQTGTRLDRRREGARVPRGDGVAGVDAVAARVFG